MRLRREVQQPPPSLIAMGAIVTLLAVIEMVAVGGLLEVARMVLG